MGEAKGREKRKSELCLSCLECCKYLTFALPSDVWGSRLQTFYYARGCKIWPTGNVVRMLVPSVCQHLNLSSGCGVYEDRPIVCREYDGRGDVFLKDTCKWNKLRRW